MKNERKIIAIDFDGTICTNKWPKIGDPNREVIAQANFEQKELGACLVLWTCRTGRMLEDAIAACHAWGLTFDYVNETPPFRTEMYGGDDPRKVSADEYWDARAVLVDNNGRLLGK